jgi:EF hand
MEPHATLPCSSAKTQTGRILAILYIPVAVSVIGSFLELISNAIISFRRQRAQRQLRNKELTLNDLKVMDGDGDGTVTKAEFLEFMLVAMNQVDQDLLDNLKAHFDRLDQDKSGTLDKNDLINVAQYNLRKEKSSKRCQV